MRSTYLFIVVLYILCLGPAPRECARILGIFPFASKSHTVVMTSLTKELARRGHELVVVNTFPLSKPMANYTDINIMPAMVQQFENMVSGKLYQMNDKPAYYIPLTLWYLGLTNMETFVKIPQVKELLNDKKGFDLVIAEAFLNEPIYGFAHHFKAPLVIVCPFGGFHWFNYAPGNPALSSYVPNSMTTFSDRMSFSERLANAMFTLLWDVGHELYYKPRQEAYRRELFGADAPSVWELERSVSLTLLNNHFSLNYPRPLVPSVVEVGGMHVMRTNNKLPDDIQQFLDGATNGAIYFSMGSNLRCNQMSPERIQALLEAFAALPQRILWKWESDSLPGQPSNVKLGKWLPQQDILAHPKVELFITHGGLLSAQEAAFHGVPLVGIPVFGDQPLNMRKAEVAGFGVMVELKNVTKESILWAVNKALQPDVRREAKRRSSVYRDQPESPLDKAVFWTEYVIRHKGAYHLRSAATSLSWYQIYLLDVAAVVLAVFLLVIVIFVKLIRMCCASNPKDKKKKKQ